MLAPILTQTVEVLRLSTFNDLDPSPSVSAYYIAPPGSLIDLPFELLIAICLFTDWKTILRCRSVCRLLKDIVDGSIELQYRIELALDGMVDGPPGSLTPGERLTRLRALRRSWSTLSWTSRMTVPMPGPCCAYELVGGIFCKTQPGRSLDADRDQDQAGHAMSSRQMLASWLPSTHDAGRTVIRNDLGIPTRDFAMDPSQDLMILFRGGEETGMPMVVVFPGALELHIKTLSTNQAHPEARVAVLCTPVQFPVTSAFLQIVDDIVGMMYCIDPAKPRITIWNWKTGNLVVDRSSSHLSHLLHGTWDFSFINSRSFFITSGTGFGSIEVFTFSCDRSERQAPSDPLTHVASLHLPSILPSVRVLSLGTHTGPFLASCPQGKPFTTSNRDRIHVLTIQYINLPSVDAPRARPRLCMVLSNRFLEGLIARHTSESAPASVPWEDWGRANTRVLPHIELFQWLRYVHGQRLVILPPGSEPGKTILQVLDFNTRNMSTSTTVQGLADDDTTGDSDSDVTTELVDFPTRIGMPNIFSDVLETALPFRETRKEVCTSYSGVMIDDERLVGLKHAAFLMGDMKEIDVFTM